VGILIFKGLNARHLYNSLISVKDTGFGHARWMELAGEVLMSESFECCKAMFCPLNARKLLTIFGDCLLINSDSAAVS
jgi:hypothetical protein